MKEILEDIWNSLLELESSNALINTEIADASQEFEDLVEKANQGIEVIDGDNNSLGLYESRLDLQSFIGEVERFNKLDARYEASKVKFRGIIFGGIIFILLAIPVDLLILKSSAISAILFPVIAVLCNAIWRRNEIKEYLDAKKSYITTKDKIDKKTNARKLYAKLLELNNKAQNLKKSKDDNKKRFESLKKKFVKNLEAEMNELYREAGIDEKVEIQSATITANSINMLRLELKGEKKDK
ncbi:MAG: hypothetical protein OSJ70_04705 [Bacilli bacterium]|nr:hypothetical protein [Bacilli bacterium]